MATLCSACSAQQLPEPTNHPPVSQTATEPALAPTATLPPLNGTLLFEEGRYKRDEICGRIFDYTQTTYGPLTIAVAKNFTELQDPQALATQVIEHYNDLSESSPVPLGQPVTIYIIPDPKNGNCYSQNQLLFVAPDEIDSQTLINELFGAATGIHEYWVKTGLVALTLGQQPDQDRLKEWYQSTDNMDMAGLFIAWFIKDWATEEEREIAQLSAASLVEYAIETENIPPDRLSEQVNNAVRTRWLESLGVDREVTYPYDGRFAGFTYWLSSECSLSVQTDTMCFCLDRLPDQEFFDEVADAEFFIDFSYYGRKALEEYILTEAPSVKSKMSTDEISTMTVKDLGSRLGFTKADENRVFLQFSAAYYSPLHEIVHTFDWNQSLLGDSLWLTEGFAEYLGMLLPIYPQTKKHAVYEDLSGRFREEETNGEGNLSYWYSLYPDQAAAAKSWYLAQGGSMEDKESVDVRLYTDAVSFATMFRDAAGGPSNWPIGYVYKTLYPGQSRWEGQDGLELSYTQAASLVAWLCDTYTLDRVLNVYVNGAEDGLLDGKTYAELKAEWQADLKSKGQGIPIPDAP
ncbi:MAG: hypothetical protein JW987_04385 [Anaerolineaceae bacterium]|nr:hypothetical protein [Anaerolineaceae bacterium]